MPHSRNRPQHHQHQARHAAAPSQRKTRQGNAAVIFAVFVGGIGLIIGYITVGTTWQLYAIIAFAALIGFFIGRKVDNSVKKK
ncbi:MAG TPA: hypothetical protein VM012_12720 [Flavitalea sp.]|nr:hypothetical protein [Flavitalea sp.]